MNKLLITRWNGRILTALRSEKRVLELGLEEEDSILGNIYIGRVQKIVKNLNAAFVDFAEGRTGYYSLEDHPAALYGKLREGDEIVVQVARDAVKTKDPVLTSNLNFTGKYAVVTSGRKGIGVSSRIQDKEFRERLRPEIEAVIGGEVGVIVRTNAYGMEKELLAEIRELMDQYRRIREKAAYRTCYSVLRKAEPEYLKTLKGCPGGSVEEIVTDDLEIYEDVRAYLEAEAKGVVRENERNVREAGGDDREAGGVAQEAGGDDREAGGVAQETGENGQVSGSWEAGVQKAGGSMPWKAPGLRLYQDPLVSLNKLYSLDTVMEQALQRKVWLRSGGYLVIDVTEAMVVIDVNTGKYSGKKTLPEMIRLINLEAAEEICCQLRLRNLSGIILVDFIDMRTEADKEALMDALRRFARQDSVKTTVVDMTQLNLVEMTRKRQKRPLWEQVAAARAGSRQQP